MAISRNDRAKQFLPFDALKGFYEALREKEIEYTEKKELSQEQIEEICNHIIELQKDDVIKIIYYKNKQYKELIGKIQNVDMNKKKIILYGDININFSDILQINLN